MVHSEPAGTASHFAQSSHACAITNRNTAPRLDGIFRQLLYLIGQANAAHVTVVVSGHCTKCQMPHRGGGPPQRHPTTPSWAPACKAFDQLRCARGPTLRCVDVASKCRWELAFGWGYSPSMAR